MAKKTQKRKTEKANSREKRITVRYSEEECAELKTSAKNAGKTLSDYLRARSLGKRVKAVASIPEVNRAAYIELSKLSSNLNQLTHHLNKGLVKSIDGNHLLDALRKTYKSTEGLRLELVNGAGNDSKSS